MQSERRKFTVLDLAGRKAQSKPITMVTAYDASSAQHVEAANIDIALVGDSAANVIQGKSSTNGMTMEQMLVHCESVARQCPNTFVVGDLPFGSYVNADVAVANAVLLIKAGCDAVKLEGGRRMAPVIKAIKNAGIVVIGHVGVTPQTSAEQGGFKTQGRDLTSALELVEDCLEVERAGASAVVLEMVVAEISAIISKVLKIPTIGIGAGGGVDGQVLVYHDLLGLLRGGHNPRFAKRYANLFDIATKGIRDFGRECLSHEFPKKQHSFLAPAGLEQSVLAELIKRGIQLPSFKQARQDPIERVCVIGGGALGSLFSHLLGKSANVVMLSSFLEHVGAVNQQGGVLIDSQLAPVKAVSSVEAVRQQFGGSEPDLIIILVKSRDTLRAAQHAAQLQGPRSIVLSLQNGIGHADVIYNLCGKERSILGTTSMAAALSGVPGSVHLNGWGPVTLSFAGWTLMGAQLSPQEVWGGCCASFLLLADPLVAVGTRKARVGARQGFVCDGRSRCTRGGRRDGHERHGARQAAGQLRGQPADGAVPGAQRRPFDQQVPAHCGGAGGRNELRSEAGRRISAVSSVFFGLAIFCHLIPLDKGRHNGRGEPGAARDGAEHVEHAGGRDARRADRSGRAERHHCAAGEKGGHQRAAEPRHHDASRAAASAHFLDCRADCANSDGDGRPEGGNAPRHGGAGAHDGRAAPRPLGTGVGRRSRAPPVAILFFSNDFLAAASCDKVVVSIYVNPTQFGPNEDFNRYPRNLEKDLQMLATLSLDPSRLFVFAPHNVYTPNHFIYVEPTGFESNGEGLCRPGHFRGVATVVLKLFNIVRPTKAFFGQKVWLVLPF